MRASQLREFRWDRHSGLYWYFACVAVVCWIFWFHAINWDVPTAEGKFFVAGIVGLTIDLILISFYATLWCAYEDNRDGAGIVEHSFWHSLLSASLGVFVFFTSAVVGLGVLYLGLFFGLTLDSDTNRRQIAFTTTTSIIMILGPLLILRTFHRFYRYQELDAELAYHRMQLEKLKGAITAVPELPPMHEDPGCDPKGQ